MAEYAAYCLKENTILDHRYRIVRVIGVGGFGITYEAKNDRVNARVAVKEFFCRDYMSREGAETDQVTLSQEEARERFAHAKQKFLEEGRVIGDFSEEPGVVGVRDSFEANGTAYIVMNYLDGETLGSWLKSHRSPEPEMLIRMFLPLMQTLSKIHQCGIIHRDISPDNIMMLPDGSLKLIDFGAARDYFANQQTHSLVLKSGYAPCEQYDEQGHQGPWTDIYALTAVLYECLTGQVPEASLMRMFHDELKYPSELGVRIPVELEQILKKGLAVDPAKRYQSVDEMLADIRQWLPEPVQEKKISRKAVLLTAAGLAVVIAAGVYGYHYYQTHLEWFKFHGQTTETVVLQADEEMSASDYEDAKEIIRNRMDLLFGEDNYLIRENGTKLELVTLLSAYEGTDSVTDFIRQYISRPWNLILGKNVGSSGYYYYYNELSREDLVSVDVCDYADVPEEIRSQWETDVNLKSEEETPEETTVICLTLSEEMAQKMSEDEELKECTGSAFLATDLDTGNAFYYRLYTDESWRVCYLPVDQYTELVEYNLIQEGVSEAFSVYEEIPADWEKDSIIPGVYQTEAENITGDTAILEYDSYEEIGSTGEWVHTIADMKDRLDALEVPYAFGISHLDEYRFVIKMAQTDINKLLAELLTKTVVRLTDVWGNYVLVTDDCQLTAEKQEDGSYVWRLKFTGNYHAEELAQLKTEVLAVEDHQLFLEIEDCKVAGCILTSDFEDGEVILDQSLLGDCGTLDESDLPLFRLIQAIINTDLPVSYDLEQGQYQTDTEKVALEPTASQETLTLVPLLDEETKEKLKEIWEGLEIYDTNSDSDLDLALHGGTDDPAELLKGIHELLEEGNLLDNCAYCIRIWMEGEGNSKAKFILFRDSETRSWYLNGYYLEEEYGEEFAQNLWEEIQESDYFRLLVTEKSFGLNPED